MRVHLKYSMLAVLVMAGIGVQSFAFAKGLGEDVVNTEQGNVKAYINTQQRSLYQIALLSGISISELRQINKGLLNETDIVRPGERILLPTSSPLLTTGDAGESSLPVLAVNKNEDGKKTDIDYQVASALKLLGEQDWNNMTSDKAKDQLKDRVRSQSEGFIRSQVHAAVIDPIETAARNLLGRFGTVQLDLNVSDQFSIRGSSLKLFSPWYDSDNTVIFTQMSIGEHDKRTIGNFGVGQRWDINNKKWLLGYNVFFDHDFSRGHNRLGVGLELWTDYLKLTANYYHPLSDWKDSKDFADYLERAARGFDVSVQGYLPSYPHLGAGLKYEQYYGDEVALFGKNNLTKDPKAVTVSVDYTPVPLFTIKGQHKQGNHSKKNAQVDFTMNYRIGVPLKDQLNPDKVALARTVKGSRYDFVDRNNNIVLEYKEQTLTVELAAIGIQPEGKVVALQPSVKARTPIKAVTWGGDSALLQIANATSKVKAGVPNPNINGWTITIPTYDPAKPTNKYSLVMHVEDIRGRKGTSNVVYVQSAVSTERKPYLTAKVVDNGVRVTGTLGFNGKDFNDPAFFDSFPNSTKNPTQADLDKILSHWNVFETSTGKPVDIILPSANAKPSGNQVVLKEIIKEVIDGVEHFNIVLDNASGDLSGLSTDFTVEPYGKSSPQALKDTNGVDTLIDSLVVVARNDNLKDKFKIAVVKKSDTANNGWVWDVPEEWMKIGTTFEVYAYKGDTSGQFDINDLMKNSIASDELNYTWALSGNNEKACNGGEFTTLDTPYTVADTMKYALKGVADSSLKNACAGDQGFNLAISVKMKK